MCMKPTSKGIDVVAFSGRRVWSRLIELRSWSRYSHVGIVCELDGDEWVIEALEGKGVRFVPLRVWYQWGGDVTAFRFDPAIFGSQERQAVIDFAKARIGCDYCSPWQFLRSFGFATRWLLRLLKVRVDLEAERWFCSELVAAAIEAHGPCGTYEPAEMTPGDVVALPYLIPCEATK